MHTPTYFASVPRLRLRDPLAQFLGAVEDGVIEYSYLDAVKLAGHSCPTVAGAYWLTCRALAVLYGETLPERGAIRAEFCDERAAGVTGVIANIVSMLTGATEDGGFKGIGGHFDRRHLMAFNVRLPLSLRFTRLDTQASVDAATDFKHIPADPAMPRLLKTCLSGAGTLQEQQQFGELWQQRVQRILCEHRDDPQAFVIRLGLPQPAVNHHGG